jgi:hypothetical protein
MEERLYHRGELEMLAGMISDMLKSREVFQKSHLDVRGAHPWLGPTLNVISREVHFKSVEAYMRRVLSTRVRQVRRDDAWKNELPLTAEVRDTAEWNRLVMQQRTGTKHAIMVTFWLHLYERLEASWARDIPNRFYFAEVAPDMFRFVGHDYTI